MGGVEGGDLSLEDMGGVGGGDLSLGGEGRDGVGEKGLVLTGEAGEVEGVGRYRFCRTVQSCNAQRDRRRERCSVFVSTPRRDTDLTQSRSRFNKGHAISHN